MLRSVPENGAPGVPETEVSTIGTLVQWVKEQPSSIRSDSPKLVLTKLKEADSGLQMFWGPNGPRIYITVVRRRPLFTHLHVAINHMGADKTFKELDKSYYWPTMRKDCRAWYIECSRCELLKAS